MFEVVLAHLAMSVPIWLARREIRRLRDAAHHA